MPIKGLVFDAYGTLYDVHSVQTRTEQLCPGKGDLITQIWRLKQLEYSWLQTALQGYRDFDFLTQAALVFALRAAGVEVGLRAKLFERERAGAFLQHLEQANARVDRLDTAAFWFHH